jgi:hypothetical protein
VSLRRLHGGECLALAGGAGLLGTLFLEWFGLQVAVPPGATGYAPLAVPDDGWTSLGRPLVALLLVCVALVVWLAVATVRGPESQSVTAGVLGFAAAAVTFLLLLVRVLTEPGLGIGVPNAAVDVRPGAYAGLVALGLLAAGAWWSLRDERPRTHDGVYEPPPARPVPE